MKEFLVGSTVLIQISDAGNKSLYLQGMIKSTYSIGCNDTFLLVQSKKKIIVLLNVLNIISITILKSKTCKEKEAKPEFEDKAIY